MQVQRLSMQRKIFYAGGQPTLATRGGGFFETVGTLQRLIEDGLQQQRDLRAWQQAAPAPVVPDAPEPKPEFAASPLPMAEPVEAEAAEQPATDMTVPEVPPKRERRRRRVATDTNPLPMPAIEEVPAAEPVSRSTAEAGRSAGGATVRSRQPGQRWLVAGAARRGRAEKHWSTRQR
jgi:hypothetical protein